MTKRSEFRANCAQERQLTKAEFERQYTRSRDERIAALSPIWAFVISLALLAICIAVVRAG